MRRGVVATDLPQPMTAAELNRELSCKFALDDFGTHLSSFGYLQHFHVDFLKIDGSFVKGVLHDPLDREIVRSINRSGT